MQPQHRAANEEEQTWKYFSWVRSAEYAWVEKGFRPWQAIRGVMDQGNSSIQLKVSPCAHHPPLPSWRHNNSHNIIPYCAVLWTSKSNLTISKVYNGLSVGLSQTCGIQFSSKNIAQKHLSETGPSVIWHNIELKCNPHLIRVTPVLKSWTFNVSFTQRQLRFFHRKFNPDLIDLLYQNSGQQPIWTDNMSCSPWQITPPRHPVSQSNDKTKLEIQIRSQWTLGDSFWTYHPWWIVQILPN